MEVVDFLVQQHREAEDLMAKALDTDNPAERLQYYKRAADHLAAHIASEEQILFPAVNAHRTEDILLESLEEHLSLKRLVADLNGLRPDDATFEPKLKVLREQAAHHHEEEEDDLFPKIRHLLPEADRHALAEAMLQLQRDMVQEGAPRAPLTDETDEAARL